MLRAYRKICTWIYRIMIAVCIVLVILMIVACRYSAVMC